VIARRPSPVIVGLGNVLLGDDGVGPAVCEELRRGMTAGRARRQLPAGTRLLDGGTLGGGLLPWLMDARAAVIVDAVRHSGRPGSVHVYRAPNGPSLEGDDSELATLLETAILAGLPREAITLVGIVPARIGPHLGLSAPVMAAVPLAASVAMREVRALAGGMA
jgi:hydrogenase maturation protease